MNGLNWKNNTTGSNKCAYLTKHFLYFCTVLEISQSLLSEIIAWMNQKI